MADETTQPIVDTSSAWDDYVKQNPQWQLQPLPAPTEASDTEVVPDTAGTTAQKSAAAGVVPAGGAAAGALTGAEIGALIPGLGETGLGELGGGFIGAIAGSLAASKAQSAVINKVSPSTEEQLAVNEQAHPIASTLGDLASSLPSFEYNPGQTIKGVATLWKMARGLPLGRTEAEIKAAKDAAVALAAQSGMGAAGSIVTPLIQGQAPNLKDIGINTLSALIFGKPRFSGAFDKLGLPTPPSAEEQGGEQPAQETSGAAPVEPAAAPTPNVTENPGQVYGVPENVQQSLTTVANKEVNEGSESLTPDDWYAVQGTTDPKHPDYHPAANVFYLQAKAAAQRDKNSAAATEMLRPDVVDSLTTEQQGGQNASDIESTEPVSEREVRPPVGKETPLQQQPEGTATASPPTGPPSEPRPEPNEVPQETDPLLVGKDFANMYRPHEVGVEDALVQQLKPEDADRIKELQKKSVRQMSAAAASNPEAFKGLMGKNSYLGGLIEGANRKGVDYDAVMAVRQAKLADLVSKVDTQSVQSKQVKGKKGRSSAPGFKEFSDTDDPKEVADSIYDDAKNPVAKGTNLETPKIALLKKGDQIIARTAYTNRTTVAGGKSVQMRYLSGEKYDDVIKDGWKPIAALKRTETTNNYRATYSLDRWNEAAKLLRDRKAADQRTVESGMAAHEAAKEFGKEPEVVEDSKVPSSEAEQVVTKTGEESEVADRLETFTPDHADAIFDSIHGQVEGPEDVIPAVKDAGTVLELEVACRDAGLLDPAKIKTAKDAGRVALQMSEKIYDAYTTSGEDKQSFQEQLHKAILDESGKSSARPQPELLSRPTGSGESQNPEAPAAGAAGSGTPESGSEGNPTVTPNEPAGPTPSAGAERPAEPAEPGTEGIETLERWRRAPRVARKLPDASVKFDPTDPRSLDALSLENLYALRDKVGRFWNHAVKDNDARIASGKGANENLSSETAQFYKDFKAYDDAIKRKSKVVNIQARITPARASEIFRQTTIALRNLGIDVRMLHAATADMAKDTAKYEEWKNNKKELGRAISISLGDVHSPTVDNLVALLHEAAHAVFARETPEMQAMLHNAISKATDEALGLNNFFEKVTGKYLSEQERANIAQEGRLAESAARSLVASGFSPAAARSVIQRIAGALKDLYQRAAIAIQQAMGLPVSSERALAYFQNRMKVALSGGKADSVISFLGGPRMTMTEWDHPNAVTIVRNRNVRGVSDQLETAVSTDIADPLLDKEPGVAAQNIVHGVLHEAVKAFNEEGHNDAGISAEDLIRRAGLPEDLYQPGELPSTKIAAANANLVKNGKTPIDPNLNISQIKNETVQKQTAALGIGDLKSLRDKWRANRRDTETEQTRAAKELKAIAGPLDRAIRDYTNLDMIASQAKLRMQEVIEEQRVSEKNIPELSGRQSMLDQVIRQLDSEIKGNTLDQRYADALNKLYTRLGGKGDMEFSDMLQKLSEYNLDWKQPAKDLRDQIRMISDPALEPLKGKDYDSRALMATAVTFAKKNDFLINLLQLRKAKALDDRTQINKALQMAMLNNKSANLEARRMIEKITTLKPLAKKLLDNVQELKERQHELIDTQERNRKFIEFHNLADPIVAQALRPLESKIGAVNVNVNVEPETKNVPVPQTPNSRPESFLRKTLYLTGKNGEITLKPEIRADLKKMSDWLIANKSNRENLGADYNEVEQFYGKLANHLCFFGAGEPIKQLWIAKWLAPTAEKLRLVNTPLAKSVAYMVENANTLYRKYRTDEQKFSREWELRQGDAMRALGITNQNNFKRDITDVFKDYVSKHKDIRSAFARNEDATEASIKAGMEHLRQDPETRKLLADPKSSKAVEDFFRKTIEVNRWLADAGKAMGNKVYDPKLELYRDVIGSEAYEFARGVSDRAQQMFNGMGAWNETMKNVAALHSTGDSDALTAMMKPRFTKPVSDGFVKWLVYKEGVSPFGAPKGKDGITDYARRDNVIKAYTNARDKNGDFNPIVFAQDLFTLEQGHEKGADMSEYVADTMHSFDANYNLLKSMTGDPAENNNNRVMPTPRRYIMDARLTDAAPREFYDYIDSDRATLGNMIRSQAYNAAFGRRMANYYNTISAAESEQSKYAQQYDNIAASIPGLEGKALRKAVLEKAAKSLDENGKPYNVAALRESHANLRSIQKAEKEIQGFLSQNQSRPPELNVLAQLMSGIGSLTVSGPGTAFIAHMVAFEQSIRNFGLNADGLGMMRDTATGSVATMMRGFLHIIGKQFAIDADHIDGLERNGLSNPNTLMKWQDQLRQVFVKPDYVHNVLGRVAIYGGRAMQVAASRLSAFHYLARVIQLGNSVAWAKKIESVVQKGMDHFSDHPEDMANPAFKFSAKQLGVTEGRAYDYLQFAAGKYGIDLRQQIEDAIQRRAGGENAPLLTDHVYQRIAQMSLDDFTMESSPTTRASFLVNNSLGQLSNPMLGWTLQKTYIVARMMREADGQRSLNGYKTASIAYAAILPMAMMAAYIRNKFDEDIQGKKQNVSDLSTIQNPQQAFLTALDNAARVGTFGIAGEALNMAVNTDNSRPMSLDGRLFFLNTLENIGSSFVNLIHQKNFDYQTVVRPMLQSLGGNGFYQYAGIINHTFGLDNQESRVMNRISVNNYLRVAGRQSSLDVRTYGGMMATASSPTPWRASIGNMVMSAYANDAEGFVAARQEAVKRLVEAGNTQPEAERKVVQYYEDSNPLRVVFRTLPTQGDYQKMLASMDDNGRVSTATAVRLYQHYAQQIGATASTFGRGVKPEPVAARNMSPLDPTLSAMMNRLQPPTPTMDLTAIRNLATRY